MLKSAWESFLSFIEEKLSGLWRFWESIKDLWKEITGTKSPTPPPIPGFQQGGIVPGPIGMPRLVIAHGGEAIVPPGKGGTIVIPVYIGNRQLVEILVDTLTGAVRQRELSV